jgi:hypothetical protein
MAWRLPAVEHTVLALSSVTVADYALLLLLLLLAVRTEALARALLPGYSEDDVASHERAFADAASAARLSAVLLSLLEADILTGQLDTAKVGSGIYYGLLQQRHAPWLAKPWALDPVDTAHGVSAGAEGAASILQQLQQRFPGLISDRREACGLEHIPSAMQAAASAAGQNKAGWPAGWGWLYDPIADSMLLL